MKFSKLYSAQPYGLYGKIVSVEIDISRGMHSFSIIGMASRSVDEARDRVGAAIKNSGFTSPKSKNEKLVVSLAPAELKKEGAYHDLAIALGYLLSAQEINFDSKNKLFIGELSLNGKVKSLGGILPLVQEAKKQGFLEVFVPFENALEAAMVDEIDIYPVHDLLELIHHLDNYSEEYKNFHIKKQQPTDLSLFSRKKDYLDFSDIKGQDLIKRGLEIAAAGGHNVAMFGSPGTGKTMLARAFTTILPKLTRKEVLEVTGIHSVAQILGDKNICTEVPIRSPHHTSSYVSIIGGGSNPKPGEITLAHRGVLFLDEFPEFDRKVLESLRQPLEDRKVTIARAQGTLVFPASFILVAAMNPCPCGFYGSDKKECTCSAYEIERYRKKISGPIIDRIDIWLPVEHVNYDDLLSQEESDYEKVSIKIRERIEKARNFSYKRNNKQILNAELSSRDLNAEFLSDKNRKLLNLSAEKMKLSPRAYHRILKLARTIADLEASKYIQEHHILEALQYRPQQ